MSNINEIKSDKIQSKAQKLKFQCSQKAYHHHQKLKRTLNGLTIEQHTLIVAKMEEKFSWEYKNPSGIE